LKFSGIKWVGMENIIIKFHCNQMSTKNVIVRYQTTVRT